VAAGVARVVIGTADPTDLAGGGATILRDAGVEVVFADDPTPFREVDVEWTHRQRTGLPFIRVKTAVTLDGRPTLAEGVRSSLTGESARAFTMTLRADADAVLVGTGTVAVDDPALTVRTTDGSPAARQPRRVVLTRTEQPSATSRMFHDGLGAVTVLLPDALDLDDALAGTGALALPYATDGGLVAAFRALADADVVSVLVEAGPRLFSALVEAHLVDELILIHAGGVAGPDAPSLYTGRTQDDISTLTREFRAVETGIVGSDAVTVWRPRYSTDEEPTG
jgi:diaminohydroxyphosphoribosylaminopyrimidine deaminase/5-amino-6-(5-phosphoribosylamino)uracil reductase